VISVLVGAGLIMAANGFPQQHCSQKHGKIQYR